MVRSFEKGTHLTLSRVREYKKNLADEAKL
jgi:hypothetical protein